MTAPSQSGLEAPTGLESQTGNPPAPRAKKLLGKCIGWGSVVLAILAVIFTILRAERFPTSDVAVLEATVIGIASRVGGPIKHLDVVDNQFVETGETLFQIDPEPYELLVAVAASNLKALQGDLINAKREIEAQQQQVAASEAVLAQARTHHAETVETYERIAPLLKPRYASPEQVDTARRAMESARAGVVAAEAEMAAALAAVADIAPIEARITGAEAALAQAELAVRDCTVRAPFPCRIVGMNLAEGAFVNIGVRVMMILDAREWYVNASFPENVLQRIRAGQRASVQLMTAPNRTFEGKVESISWAVTDMPSLPLAQVPFIRRELDWVRLTQRFPVRIRISPSDTDDDLFRSGATASVTILTDDAP